jgi:hypothetical protein
MLRLRRVPMRRSDEVEMVGVTGCEAQGKRDSCDIGHSVGPVERGETAGDGEERISDVSESISAKYSRSEESSGLVEEDITSKSAPSTALLCWNAVIFVGSWCRDVEALGGSVEVGRDTNGLAGTDLLNNGLEGAVFSPSRAVLLLDRVRELWLCSFP